MPEEKKYFNIEGTTVEIPQDELSDFVKNVPDAVEVKPYIVDQDTLAIPLDEVEDFVKNVPNAKPLISETELTIQGEGTKAAKGGVAAALGKPQAKPTKSGGSGSAMSMSSVELQSQLPSTLTAQEVKSQIEQVVPQANMLGLDYEKIAEESQGKSLVDIAFEQVQKIKDPKEKFETTKNLYNLAAVNVTNANTELRGNLQQMENGLSQMQQEIEQGKAEYQKFVDAGDTETANQVAEMLNQQIGQYQQAFGQYEGLSKDFNDNAKFLGVINAGRMANFDMAREEGLMGNATLPIGTAVFANMIGNTNLPFSPQDVYVSSTWNAIAPNVVRTLASAVELTGYFDSPMGANVSKGSKQAGQALLDFANNIEIDASQFTPKATSLNLMDDINPYSIAEFAGSLTGSIAGSIGSAGFAGSGTGAMVFNAAQGYGGMYAWGKEAGLNATEASALAAPVGLVYGYLGDKGVESLTSIVGKQSFKKLVTTGIKELGKYKTQQGLSQVFLNSLKEFAKNTAKGAVKEGVQEGVEFSSEFGMKVLASEQGLVKTDDDLTVDAYMKGLKESMTLGALGGGVLGGTLGNSPRRTLSNVVAEATIDPNKEVEFLQNMNSLLEATQITQQQYDDVIGMLEKSKEANTKVPKNVTNVEARGEAIDLIQEKEELTQEVETIDPAMAKPMTDRIASIDQRLQDISEGKSLTRPEDIQQEQEGMIEMGDESQAAEPIDVTLTQEFDLESQSVDELEKRQFEIEESKSESDRKLFNDIDKELESREWNSVINAPLSEINGILDFLAEKEKTKPNGFGAYIDKTDARKTREVVDKYSKDVSRKEAIRDFKDAFLGNPSNSYADAIKLRESTRSFIESGGTFKQLLSFVSNEFAQDGFSEQDAASVVNRKLQEISSKNTQTTNEETIQERPVLEELPTEGNEGQAGQESAEVRTEETGQEEVTPTTEINAEGQQNRALRNESEQVQTERAVDSDMPIVNETELQNRETITQEGQEEVESDPFEAFNAIAEELGREAAKEGQKKNWSDTANKLAEGLDNLIDDIDNSGVAMSSIPFAKQIARKALVIFRDAFRAGGLTIDAFQAAYEQMKDALRKDTEFADLNAEQQRALEKDLTDEIKKFLPTDLEGKQRQSKFGARVKDAFQESPLYKKADQFLNPNYSERKQKEVEAFVGKLKEIFPDKVAQREIALEGTLPNDVSVAMLFSLYGDAKAAYEANPTQENLNALTQAKQDLQDFGTSLGQGVSYFRKGYELFPELQIDKLEKELDAEAERAMGKSESKNTANDLHKAKKVRTDTLAARTDVFNAIGNALQGIPSFLSNITDGKVRNALKTLLNFGKLMDANQKELLSGFLAQVKESGQLAVAKTRADVEALVRENLSDINGRLKNPYSPKDFNRVVDAFMELYENLATTAIEQAIESQFPTKRFSISRNKNSKIAKLILYGALDDVELRRKFALKYDIPFIGDTEAKKLQELAQRVDRSSGGAKKLAQRELDTYIAKIKRGQSPLMKAYNKYLNLASDLGSLIINNILFNIATPALALTSNTIRLGAAIGKYAVTFQFDVLKFAFKQGLKKEVTLGDGKKRTLPLNRVIDGALAALGGIPRLSEYSLQGVSVQEAKTRRAKTRTERALRRVFLTPSSRLFSAIDAAVTPYYSAMDSYSTYKKLIKQMYKEAGNNNVDNVTLDQDVKSIIGFDTSNFDEIANQAYDDVMNSTLMQDLIAQGSWDINNEFPDANSRRSLNSAAAQIYNEYVTRIYEIYNDGFNQRFFELQNRKDALGRDLFDPTKDYSPILRDIDKFIAKNTNEIAFFGTPPGTFGLAAEITGKMGNALPFFKYSGYFPIFNNAMWNAAAYSVKMYGGLNLIQYLSYKATGRRRLLTQKPFDEKFVVNLDQQNMAVSATVSSAMALAIHTFLSNLYDTPEEEKDALANGTWTGAVTRLTSAQRNTFRDANGDPLKEGMFYYKGFPSFPYNRTPLHGVFEAGAYTHNSNLFNADYRKNDLFLEDDRESTAWETALSYLANGVYISFETTSAKQMSDIVNVVLDINPDQIDDNKAEGLAKDFENKMSGLISNLIPYNRLQKQVADFFYTKDGFNKKRANTFMDKILVKTAFSNYIIKSNATDPFGRPLSENWDVQGLTMGFNTFELKGDEVRTILDVVYEKDPYMQMHIKHNYGYNAPHTHKTWVRVEVDEMTPIELKNQIKSLKAEGSDVRIPEGEKPRTTDEMPRYYEYLMNVEDDEINLINEAMGKTVKEFVDEQGNMAILNNPRLTNKGYKDLMNMVYEYGKQRELYRLHKNELGDAYKEVMRRKLESIRRFAVDDLDMTLPKDWQ